MIDLTNFKADERIVITCDQCSKNFERTKRNILSGRNKHNRDLCISCIAKNSVHLKPQCQQSFWTEEKRNEHGKGIASSENYLEAISKQDRTGQNNSMFGKKHNELTKQRMSKSRTGKIGENATAWKGGKTSVNARVKKHIHMWFRDVIVRDRCCQKCGSTKQLDAHHIIPISTLIKEHLSKYDPLENDLRYLYLIQQEDILDAERTNGIALCRSCHKKEHLNWGSHNPRV